MNNEWKMEEFSVLEIDKNLSNKKFVVPRYQRGVDGMIDNALI